MKGTTYVPIYTDSRSRAHLKITKYSDKLTDLDLGAILTLSLRYPEFADIVILHPFDIWIRCVAYFTGICFPLVIVTLIFLHHR